MNVLKYSPNLVPTEFSGGGGHPKPSINKAFTMLDPLHCSFGCNCAFTMAEILISLTIIGIIAAITLPALQSNINEKVWNTQRKALYSRMSQAIALMSSVNGYGQYSGTWDDDVVTVNTDTTAMAFVTEGLSKVFKINNICDENHLPDCGFTSGYTTFKGIKKNVFPTTLEGLNSAFTHTADFPGMIGYINPQKHINTKVVAFETQNGESILTYYNPACISSDANFSVDMASYGITNPLGNNYIYSQPYMCANFVYDLNGSKGPNTVGKDMGVITVLYSVDSKVVAPNISFMSDYTTIHQNAARVCTDKNDNSRITNIEELYSIYYNRAFYDIDEGDNYYWSSTVADATRAWVMRMGIGVSVDYPKERTYKTICISK